MFPTAAYDIYANRFAPHSDYVDVVGYDYTGAVLAMEVRDSRNGGTVRATVTPTVSVTTSGGVPTSRIAWAIPEATMAAMPTDPTTPSKDVTLYYDLHLTPSGEDLFVPFGGKFVVVAGVTE